MADSTTNPQNNTTSQNISNMNSQTQDQAQNLQNNANNNAGVNPDTGVNTGASAGGLNPSAGQPATATGNLTNRQQQQRGTGFTNIQNILSANQGAGQRIGNAIGGQLNNQASAIRQGIQQGQSDFQAGEQSAVGTANQNIATGQALEQQNGESNADYATRIAQNNNDLAAQGLALQNTAYTGPSGLTNADQLQAKAGTVAQLGQLAGSNSGEQELLRNFVAAKGNYTQGQSALDQLLLGQGGQQAVQQGARNVYGVDTQATGAITSANQQATAATNAIDTNRAATIQAIRDAATGSNGITTQATQQATDFNNQAQRLSQILQGTDSSGNPITSLSASDLALLNNAQQYGLSTDSSLYEGNTQNQANTAAMTTAALQQLAQYQNNVGGQYYQGNQQAAGVNLAKFLGDQSLQGQIQNNNFDTDVFKTDPNVALAQLNAEKTYDTGTQSILKDIGSQAQTLQNQVGQYNTLQSQLTPLQAQMAQYNQQGFNQPNVTQSYETSMSPQDFAAAQALQSQIAGIQSQESGLQQSDNFSASGDNFHPVNNSMALNIGNQYSNPATYGMLAFGDQGDQNIGQRFQNLGLYADASQGSGDIRNASQFQTAAQNALGGSQSLRDYILSQFANQGGGAAAPATAATTDAPITGAGQVATSTLKG